MKRSKKEMTKEAELRTNKIEIIHIGNEEKKKKKKKKSKMKNTKRIRNKEKK
jgi:hypothetical protein